MRKEGMWSESEESTYLRVQVINARDGILDVAPLQGLPDVHPTLDAIKIHWGDHARLPAELLSSRFVPLDDEVVHHQPVQITMHDKLQVSIQRKQPGEARMGTEEHSDVR